MGVRNIFPKSDFAIKSKVIRRTLEPITQEQISLLEKNLAELPKILGDKRWFLSGGIAVQIGYGKFYRNPGNFNIDIHEDCLADIVEKAQKSRDYRLFSRGWQVRTAPDVKLETYEVPEWADGDLRKSYPNLRLIRFESGKPVPNLNFLDFIDVHPHRIVHHKFKYSPQFNRKEIISLDKNESDLRIPAEYADQNIFYKTPSGIITIRSLLYMEVIKKWLFSRENRTPERKEIDNYDLLKIQEAKSRYNFTAK